MASSLFEIDGDSLLPTELARGPWSPEALHGGPVAALLARAGERVAADAPMHPARLTIELLRPVPLAPLRTTARVARPGRKVQLVEISLASGEREVARATLLRIRSAPVPLPEGADAVQRADAPEVGPEDARPLRPAFAPGEHRAFHNHATEHRAARGSWSEPGPIVDWIRLRYPVVAGEAPTPLQRVAAAADFGNGISWVLPYQDYTFINPDLTIALHRLPEGEWICLDAATLPSPGGVGIAESALYDVRGRIGRGVQTLLLEKR
jgi:acyl-Coa thioesterase superfamily protein/acyl-CoA thioesterase superfamily protein